VGWMGDGGEEWQSVELDVPVLGARRREDGVGHDSGGGRGPFYRVKGEERRRSDEGNDRRWSVPLMAFKPSFLGKERRG
jgi:hypothetical protein